MMHKVGLYRIEVGISAGTGKLKTAGGVDSSIRECLNRAFGYLQGNKVKLGVGGAFDTSDMHVEVIDLLANRISCEAGSHFWWHSSPPCAKVPLRPVW